MTMYAVRAISAVLAMLYTMMVLGTCSAVTPPGEVAQADAPQIQIPLGTSSTVSVNILNPHQEAGLPLQQASDLFLANRPDYKISVHTVESPAEYQSYLRAKLGAGEQLDIFHITGTDQLLELLPHLRDLSHLEWAGTALPETLEPVMLDDAIYGIPYSVEGIGLIANRNMFQAAGINPVSIQTFADLEEAYAELRSQIDSGELEDAYPDLRYVTEFPALDKAFLGTQVAGLLLDGSFTSPRQAAESAYLNLHSEELVGEYVELSARYTSSRRDWSGLGEVARNFQVESGLLSGRVAVIQQSTEIWRRAARVDEAMLGRLALLPIPLEPEEEGFVYTHTPSWWVINAGSTEESARLAEEFLTWLYNTDTGATFLADKFAILSPYRDTAKSTGVSLHTQLLRYMEGGGTKPLYIGAAPPGWGSDVFYSNFQRWLADEITWNELIEDCTLKWRQQRKN